MSDTCPNCGGPMLTSGYAHMPNCPALIPAGSTVVHRFVSETEVVDLRRQLNDALALVEKMLRLTCAAIDLAHENGATQGWHYLTSLLDDFRKINLATEPRASGGSSETPLAVLGQGDYEKRIMP